MLEGPGGRGERSGLVAEAGIYEGRAGAPRRDRRPRGRGPPVLPGRRSLFRRDGCGHVVHMMRRHLPTRALGRAAVAALLAGSAGGCGDEPPTQEFYVEPSMPDNPIARTQAAAADVADREALPPTSPILPLGAPEVSGEVRVTPAAAGLEIEIRVGGLTGVEAYAAHVHRGVCAEGGPVAAALSPVEARADGNGVSHTAVPAATLSATEPLFVQIHGATGAPIACGDLMGP